MHLVVIKVISDIVMLRITLHEFFQHPKIHNIYQGKNIGRFLEQRWTGHLAVAKVVLTNFQEILNTLTQIPQEKFDGGTVAKSLGLGTAMKKLEFRFDLTLAHKILSLLKSVNNALESRSMGLKEAVSVVYCAIEQVRKLRTGENYQEILTEAINLIPDLNEHQQSQQNLEPGRKRKPIVKTDFLLTEPLPSTSICDKQDLRVDLKRQYFEILDLLLSELDRRFGDNDELLQAVASIDEFDLNKLQYLTTLGK